MELQYAACQTNFQRRIVSFAARRMFRDGVELADHDYRAQPYEPGTLTLYFQQDRKGVSRAIARFVKLSGANASDVFPPLWSARLIAIGEQGLRLNGWESADDRHQRQAWHVVYGYTDRRLTDATARIPTLTSRVLTVIQKPPSYVSGGTPDGYVHGRRRSSFASRATES